MLLWCPVRSVILNIDNPGSSSALTVDAINTPTLATGLVLIPRVPLTSLLLSVSISGADGIAGLPEGCGSYQSITDNSRGILTKLTMDLRFSMNVLMPAFIVPLFTGKQINHGESDERPGLT